MSYALEQSPNGFRSLYVATVGSSEETGTLPEGLTRYIAYESQMDVIKKKIITSFIYPVLTAAVSAQVTALLRMFVVKRGYESSADEPQEGDEVSTYIRWIRGLD